MAGRAAPQVTIVAATKKIAAAPTATPKRKLCKPPQTLVAILQAKGADIFLASIFNTGLSEDLLITSPFCAPRRSNCGVPQVIFVQTTFVPCRI